VTSPAVMPSISAPVPAMVVPVVVPSEVAPLVLLSEVVLLSVVPEPVAAESSSMEAHASRTRMFKVRALTNRPVQFLCMAEG
jgi:hypothetical protein